MATLSELIADRAKYGDNLEIPVGYEKFTLGQLRELQSATGKDVAAQVDAERQKIAAEQQRISAREKELTDAQLAVAELYRQLNNQPQPTQYQQPSQSTSWREDPFFAPVAKDWGAVEKQLQSVLDQNQKLQTAFASGLRYVVDRFVDQDYRSLPEDFRKEVPRERALATANERKYMDEYGVPDIRKTYQDWEAPRKEEALRRKIREEVEADFAAKQSQSMLPRPGSLPNMPPARDVNAPKDMKESFNRLKSNPADANNFYASLVSAAGITPQ